MTRTRALTRIVMIAALVVLPWAGTISAACVGEVVSSGVCRSWDDVETARVASEPATAPAPRARTLPGGPHGATLDSAAMGVASIWNRVAPIAHPRSPSWGLVPVADARTAPPVFLRNCAFLC